MEIQRERCTRLARMLRLAPHRHDQSNYIDEKERNECGTVGCAGGWATLWSLGRVDIDEVGVMTWPAGALQNGTLIRWSEEVDYHAEGARWLGLAGQPADVLFLRTLRFESAERLAVEVLERLGDGRLNNDTLTLDALNELAEELDIGYRRYE